MGWEFGYFEKHVSWILDCRRVELIVYWGPVRLSFTGASPVGSGLWPCQSWSWVKTMVLKSWSLTMEFCRSLPTDRDLKDYDMCRAFELCWYRMIKDCVSLFPRVEEPNSELKKLINVRTWTTESPVYLSPPAFLHMYNVCDGCGYTTKGIIHYKLNKHDKNSGKHFVRHSEPLDSCFDLIILSAMYSMVSLRWSRIYQE